MKITMTNARDLPERVTAILNKRGKWTGKELGYIYAIQYIAQSAPMFKGINLITGQEATKRLEGLGQQAEYTRGYWAIADVCEYCLGRQSLRLAAIGNNLLEAMAVMRDEIAACEFEVITRSMPIVQQTVEQMKEKPKSLTTHLTDVSDEKLKLIRDNIPITSNLFHQMKLTQLFFKLIFDKFDLPFYDTFDVFVTKAEAEFDRYNATREEVLKRLGDADTVRRDIMNTSFSEIDLNALDVTADEALNLTQGVKRLKLKEIDTSILYRVAGDAAG